MPINIIIFILAMGFMGLSFDVTEDVLIPEQDTEILVEDALRFCEDKMRVLDLCTGSGCIGLSILNYTNETKALCTDISEKALSVRERLVILSEAKNPISFRNR